jgi:DNA-binding PadR family transcriptional regulator
MHSPELLKGTLQTIVLKLLKDHGKMYGYEITQRVKELSVGRILLTEGALYPAPHKLEDWCMLRKWLTSASGYENIIYSHHLAKPRLKNASKNLSISFKRWVVCCR